MLAKHGLDLGEVSLEIPRQQRIVHPAVEDQLSTLEPNKIVRPIARIGTGQAGMLHVEIAGHPFRHGVEVASQDLDLDARRGNSERNDRGVRIEERQRLDQIESARARVAGDQVNPVKHLRRESLLKLAPIQLPFSRKHEPHVPQGSRKFPVQPFQIRHGDRQDGSGGVLQQGGEPPRANRQCGRRKDNRRPGG